MSPGRVAGGVQVNVTFVGERHLGAHFYSPSHSFLTSSSSIWPLLPSSKPILEGAPLGSSRGLFLLRRTLQLTDSFFEHLMHPGAQYLSFGAVEAAITLGAEVG